MVGHLEIKAEIERDLVNPLYDAIFRRLCEPHIFDHQGIESIVTSLIAWDFPKLKAHTESVINGRTKYLISEGFLEIFNSNGERRVNGDGTPIRQGVVYEYDGADFAFSPLIVDFSEGKPRMKPKRYQHFFDMHRKWPFVAQIVLGNDMESGVFWHYGGWYSLRYDLNEILKIAEMNQIMSEMREFPRSNTSSADMQDNISLTCFPSRRYLRRLIPERVDDAAYRNIPFFADSIDIDNYFFSPFFKFLSEGRASDDLAERVNVSDMPLKSWKTPDKELINGWLTDFYISDMIRLYCARNDVLSESLFKEGKHHPCSERYTLKVGKWGNIKIRDNSNVPWLKDCEIDGLYRIILPDGSFRPLIVEISRTLKPTNLERKYFAVKVMEKEDPYILIIQVRDEESRFKEIVHPRVRKIVINSGKIDAFINPYQTSL